MRRTLRAGVAAACVGLLLVLTACTSDATVRAPGSQAGGYVPQPAPAPAPAADTGAVLRGVNVFDLAWYAGYHGTTFSGQPQAGYDYLASRGVRLVRLPFIWPALQPSLHGPLDAQYLRAIEEQVSRAGRAGIKVVLDLHNGCHYPDGEPGRPGTKACGAGISTADLNDAWLRLSQVFRGNKSVLAYDIMNEPNHLGPGVWQRFSQATVSALRAAGDDTELWIEGTTYAAMDNWVHDQPRPWITDPANNIVYSAHIYFADTSYTQGYDPSAYPISQAHALPAMERFIAWLAKYRVRGSVGEVGWPSSHQTDTWRQWNALGDRWYQLADTARLPVTYFSATSAFDEPNAAYAAPHNDDGCGRDSIPACSPPPISVPLSQSQVIEKHLSLR